MRGRLPRIGPLGVALAIGAIALVAALATGDADDGKARRTPAEATGGDSQPRSRVSFLARLIPPPPEQVKGPVAPRSVTDLAKRLPLERAVAQLFLFGFDGKDATAPIFEELRRLDLGGVVLDGRNYESPQQLAGLAGEVSVAARSVSHIPPWVMAEQDGGDFSQFPDLPPAKAPGEIGTPAAAAAAVGETAIALKTLAFNGLLEPDLDVSSEDGGPLGARAFSDSAADVAEYGRLAVKACRDALMLCAPKHFPGVGAASAATDEGPAQVGLSLASLERRDMTPFAAAAKAGAPAIVIGHGLYEPDSFVTPASTSPAIIGGLLRKRLGYGGVAITDDLADPGVSTFAPVPDAAVAALKAGADLIFISGTVGDQEAAYTAVLNAVRSGDVPEKRVREALLRVLLTKRAYQLLQG